MYIECEPNSFKVPGGSAWNPVLWTNDMSFFTAKQCWAVPPTPQIVTPGSGSIVSEPVAVTATFPATGCSISEDNRLLASITSAPYSFSWTGASAGPHTIRAVATDGNGRIAVSEPVGFTVQ